MISSLLYRCYSYLLSNFRFSNIFRISSFLKLAVIYSISILVVIIIDHDFSKGFWGKLISSKLSNYRISIYSVKDRMGEGLLYDRVQKALDKIGVDHTGVKFSESLTHFWLTKHLYKVSSSLVNYLFKPNFNLTLTHHVNILPYGYNITYLNVPSTLLYNVNGKFKVNWQHLTEYDAYIDLYSFVHGKNKALDAAIKAHGLEDKKIVSAYIGQDYVEYSPADIQEAVITGSLWGCNRESLRVRTALKNLANDGLLYAYGPQEEYEFLGSSYIGPLENFGKNITDNLLSMQKQHGISLVIHSLEHMLEGIPTSRISEAAAAGTLVISDKNYFIENFFGDNVLYFNVFGNDEQIYAEIKSHIEWAKSNVSEAQSKAKATYDIFINNFTVEKQLQSLIDLFPNIDKLKTQ